MSEYEKVTEEGMDFINLMLLPLSTMDYLQHKNQIDLLIREFKHEYGKRIDMWGWEMKNIFPTTALVSDSSNKLTGIILRRLLMITMANKDKVFQILGKDTFAFKLERLTEPLETFLMKTLKDANKEDTIIKLNATNLEPQVKLIIGITISSEVFLSEFNLVSPDNETSNALVEYSLRIRNDNDNIKKIFSMCNCLLSGLIGSEIEIVESIIQNATDENGSYSEIDAMKQINEYFGLEKHVQNISKNKKL